MHELGLAREIVRIVTRAAAGARVVRVVVRVGAWSCVEPTALGLCFDLAAAGTPAAEASLEVKRTEAPSRLDELVVEEMEVV